MGLILKIIVEVTMVFQIFASPQSPDVAIPVLACSPALCRAAREGILLVTGISSILTVQ